MKQLEACVSKLCRAARRVVVEVVVAKSDNWRRAISGKEVFKLNRKNGFGQLQSSKKQENKSSERATFFRLNQYKKGAKPTITTK